MFVFRLAVETFGSSSVQKISDFNVHRWYEPGTGRYGRADPLGRDGDPPPYAYALSNPLTNLDVLGLKVRVCCKKIPLTPAPMAAFPFVVPGGQARHCYLDFAEDGTLGLHNSNTAIDGIRASVGLNGPGRIVPNHRFDRDSDSFPNSDCGDFSDCGDDCARTAGNAYPPKSVYRLFGPNSNTLAGSVARQCGLDPPNSWELFNAPGWFNSPAKPSP